MKPCERCGHRPGNALGILDFCVKCCADLCDGCLDEGCCGSKPAESSRGTPMVKPRNPVETIEVDKDFWDKLAASGVGTVSSREKK